MSIFTQRYQKLNAQQKLAVDTLDGPVVVVAGPGSGKTELLGLRVANILQKTDTSPNNILCLTFTDAAAHNMRERLASIIGNEAYKVSIHTFHSFSNEIIIQYPQYFYDGAEYKSIDDIMSVEILTEVLSGLFWDSGLRKSHPELGYIYLEDIRSNIVNLKNGGLDPQGFRELLMENKMFEDQVGLLFDDVFRERISAKTLSLLEGAFEALKLIQPLYAERNTSFYKTEQEVIVQSLEDLLSKLDYNEKGKIQTKPITAWKNNFLKKNIDGKWQLRSVDNYQNLMDLAKVYELYQDELHKRCLYDFADMILKVVKELENNNEFRFEVQEKYLYIMVDEFQDTNGLQSRLLDAVVNYDVNEGRPNVLVVGDDDQAIYKFQGANLANIIGFIDKYQGVKKIVLTKNYRSAANLIQYNQGVITQSQDRLSSKYADIIKIMQCANQQLGDGEVCQKVFNEKIEQYIYIAQEIKQILLNDSVQVAIISRNHNELENISKVLDYYQIAFDYNKSRNIWESEHIQAVLLIARFINSLNNYDLPQADELLVQILHFEFWGLERVDIWKVSYTARHRNQNNWLEVMLGYGGKIQQIAEFLIALGVEAKRKTAEEVLDLIVGTTQLSDLDFSSPLKSYYFSNNISVNSSAYLDYLFDLQFLFTSLREYNSKQVLYIADLIYLHDTYLKLRKNLYVERKMCRVNSRVTLLTAHKSKGLEFDVVFVVNCNEAVWMKSRGGNRKLPLPINIPLAPEIDSEDDCIRLFFVAITRAKQRLFLTNYKYKDSAQNRMTENLRFLDGDLATTAIEPINVDSVMSEGGLLIFKEQLRSYSQIANYEKESLKGFLENYQLSVTHLNNFLDVANMGPAGFLERNILYFPEAKSPASDYGSAIHNSFVDFYNLYQKTKILPALEIFLTFFEKQLLAQRLNSKDFDLYLKRGCEELSFYYNHNSTEFNVSDRLAVNFKYEGVVIDNVRITGEIDRMVYVNKNTVNVCDYKTGTPTQSWDEKENFAKIKLFKYRNQLIFYKILVENAKNFSNIKVSDGMLDFITKNKDESKGTVKLSFLISDDEVAQMKSLLQVVYNKILNLDFPDTSEKYSKDFAGILKFRDDLLSGNV